MNISSQSISVTKAVAIILMVMAHSGCWHFAQQYINMFHMPLFIIMSGYCFKERYVNDERTFIKRRIKGLYVPFVKWSLLFLLLHNVFFDLHIYDDVYGFHGETLSPYTWSDIVKRVIHIVVSMERYGWLLGGFWFLKALLVASIVSLFIIKYVRRTWIALLAILLITMIIKEFDIYIPFFSNKGRSALAIAFFLTGYGLKSMNIDVKPWMAILFAALLAGLTLLVPISMLDYTAATTVPYYVGAVMGSLMIVCLANAITDEHHSHHSWLNWLRSALVYVGNHTLEILTWHFLCFKLVSLCLIHFHGLPIEMLACYPVIPNDLTDLNYYCSYWWAYFIVGVTVPLLIGKGLTRIASLFSREKENGIN